MKSSICILFSFSWLVCPTIALGQPQTFNVWPGQPPGETGNIGKEKILPDRKGRRKVKRITNVTQPTIAIHRPAKDKDTGAAVLICPGGGYGILAWDLEGEEVATWLNSIGVTGIVLKYRVPRRPSTKTSTFREPPLMDAQRAMSLVRSNAKKWGIDPKRIGMLGFSAGGHLTANASTNFDRRSYKPIDEIDQVSCRPDFSVLIYPAYLLSKDKTKLAPEIRVSSNSPPMFFAHAGDDGISAENSVRMYLALRKAGVPSDLHIYAKGGHGFGLRPSSFPCSTWPRSCDAWLRSQGFLKKQ